MSRNNAGKAVISSQSVHRGLMGLIASGCVVCGQAAPYEPSATTSLAEWPNYGDAADQQRFSPLTEINGNNIGRLGLAWALDLAGESSLEATPLEVEGVLYFTGSNETVYAVDARSGQLLWKFDPAANKNVPREIRMVWPVNRGVAYWHGMVYLASRDCRMTAINAKSGRVVWSNSFSVPGVLSTSSGAPTVLKDKVIIGNSGADFGGRGYVTAFDAKSGKLLWRFFTVPGDPAKGFENRAMELAAKTWSGEWWKYGGGGTPWSSLTFDQELNQVYIGTGNGGPWNGNFRSPHKEDNLFLASVVALNADTGEYKWHYQYNPAEFWDYKATADIVLADLTIAGRRRKVLMQAPTNGFFYVIDRRTGKVISAEKTGKVTWADRIDLESGRPVERPGIRGEGPEPVIIYPSSLGTHNWEAMSYSPATGLVYIPYTQLGMKFGPVPSVAQAPDVTDHPERIALRAGEPIDLYMDPNDPLDGHGALLAWDPVAQKPRWRVVYPALINAGTLATAGNLVFQGTDTGRLYAYSADTGTRLWEFNARLGIIAPPISYSVGGHQYISILVGAGAIGGFGQGWKYGLQPRRLLTFCLDGKGLLPATPPPDLNVQSVDDPALELDPTRVEKGKSLYVNMACRVCHGVELDAGGTAPDLRASRVALNSSAFKALLHDGSLVARGMPQFDDLTTDEADDIYQYIRWGARRALPQRSEGSGGAPP